ncbi:hypothetical protein RB625_19725 [Streptomyces californicus]|uniref:hypothetical protein n=1 Tax=Streptomyces californicus TaxID=67351 RepID=UPI00296FA7CD|nr:hypothetical protein [Streptomyces californicus]MDW4900642.1 hypothetical protein [Streptomyces californicus]
MAGDQQPDEAQPTEAQRVAELHRQAAADYAGRHAREAEARTAAAYARAHGNAAAATR